MAWSRPPQVEPLNWGAGWGGRGAPAGPSPAAGWPRDLEPTPPCGIGSSDPVSACPSTGCPVFQCFIRISAAYGSTKDISVYSVLGLLPSQIFIVGRPTKKYQAQCQVGVPGRVGAAWAGSAVHSVVFVHSFICPLTHLFIRSFAVSTRTTGTCPGPGPGAVGCPVIQAAVPVARGLMDDGGHGVVTPPGEEQRRWGQGCFGGFEGIVQEA